MRRRLMAAAVLLASFACTEQTTLPAGRTSVYLTDSPFPFNRIQSVNVRIVSVEASRGVDTTNGIANQNWTSVAEPNRTVDLLALQGGVTTLIGESDIPAGQYRAIRMTIDPTLSSVTASDGSQISVAWGQNGPFTIYAGVEDPLPVSGDGGRVVIDFDVGRSFRVAGNGLLFIPWLRAVNENATGSIRGVVRTGEPAAALRDAMVSAYRNGVLVGTARTGPDGKYSVSFLPAGTFRLMVEAPVTPPAVSGPCGKVENVGVTVGQATTADYVLPPVSTSCESGANPDSTGGPQTGGPVASVTVTISPPRTTVALNDSLGFSAQLKDAAGVTLYDRKIEWSSSNTDVLPLAWSYGSFAIARPKATGTATVTATSEGKSGSVTITVQ